MHAATRHWTPLVAMVQEVDLQKMDTAQDVLLATPCPKETTLYGTNKVRWRYTRPRGHSTEGRAQGR